MRKELNESIKKDIKKTRISEKFSNIDYAKGLAEYDKIDNKKMSFDEFRRAIRQANPYTDFGSHEDLEAMYDAYEKRFYSEGDDHKKYENLVKFERKSASKVKLNESHKKLKEDEDTHRSESLKESQSQEIEKIESDLKKKYGSDIIDSIKEFIDLPENSELVWKSGFNIIPEEEVIKDPGDRYWGKDKDGNTVRLSKKNDWDTVYYTKDGWDEFYNWAISNKKIDESLNEANFLGAADSLEQRKKYETPEAIIKKFGLIYLENGGGYKVKSGMIDEFNKLPQQIKKSAMDQARHNAVGQYDIKINEEFNYDYEDLKDAEDHAHDVHGELQTFSYETGESLVRFKDGSFKKYDSEYNEIPVTSEELYNIARNANELMMNPHATHEMIAFAEKQLDWAASQDEERSLKEELFDYSGEIDFLKSCGLEAHQENTSIAYAEDGPSFDKFSSFVVIDSPDEEVKKVYETNKKFKAWVDSCFEDGDPNKGIEYFLYINELNKGQKSGVVFDTPDGGQRFESLKEDLGQDKSHALAKHLGYEKDTDVDTDDGKVFTTLDDSDYLVLTEDEAYEAAVEEIKSIVDELGLDAFTPEFQKQILNSDSCVREEPVMDFIKDEIEYFETEEDDPDMLNMLRGIDNRREAVAYVKDVLTDSFESWARRNKVFDIDEIAEEAIKADGVAHFISYYDGQEIDLGDGLYAYRLN